MEPTNVDHSSSSFSQKMEALIGLIFEFWRSQRYSDISWTKTELRNSWDSNPGPKNANQMSCQLGKMAEGLLEIFFLELYSFENYEPQVKPTDGVGCTFQPIFSLTLCKVLTSCRQKKNSKGRHFVTAPVVSIFSDFFPRWRTGLSWFSNALSTSLLPANTKGSHPVHLPQEQMFQALWEIETRHFGHSHPWSSSLHHFSGLVNKHGRTLCPI